MNSDEFRAMPWGEFCDLMTGIGDDTPLGRVVRIRTETDREAIRNMTPGQRRMRADWQRQRAEARTKDERATFLRQMQEAFARAFGGD